MRVGDSIDDGLKFVLWNNQDTNFHKAELVRLDRKLNLFFDVHVQFYKKQILISLISSKSHFTADENIKKSIEACL